MVRSIPFTRVIRGLEGSQSGGGTVRQGRRSYADNSIRFSSIFAAPPHDPLSADALREQCDGILGLCRSVNNKLIG
ncbi:hypothetical protein PBY51_004539 [Eleginops maclovinus]|uniref:Uncharacterized protein n=1 Tax=Eleginops maclovinus TaxID=56733 RepID=A0AAN7Y2Y5_ELEMC|nr:hypothetical protein PBY51_004539 [Eleginops maclovinus]